MSVGAITAGEAYVSITCDNAELVAGLRESSATIQATARSVAAAEDKLTVNVGVEGVGALESALTKVESAIGRVQKEIKESSATLAAFSSGVLGGLKDAVASTCSAFGTFGDSFNKMALRTGLSTEALSEYAHAAAMCGADISNVEGALKGRAARLNDAERGSAEAAKKFARLGLSVESLARLSSEARFEAISLAIAGIVAPTERAALE